MVVTAVALSVFRESVRDKVFYNLLLFAIVLVMASLLIGQLTASQDLKIIKDLGLSATSIFGLFIAVFVGISLVWKEVERRSIYSLLAKPIRRSELIVGKYLGLAFTLLVNVAVMAATLYAVLAYMNAGADAGVRASWDAPALDPRMLVAMLLIWFELLVVTAVAIFFSAFSSPMLSAVFTFGLWVVGHFNADLKHFESVVESRPVAWLARALYYLLPNLSPFDIKTQVVHAQPVAAGYVGMTLAYGLVYITALIVAAAFIFSRRDFK